MVRLGKKSYNTKDSKPKNCDFFSYYTKVTNLRIAAYRNFLNQVTMGVNFFP